jgi:hypothetical protein
MEPGLLENEARTSFINRKLKDVCVDRDYKVDFEWFRQLVSTDCDFISHIALKTASDISNMAKMLGIDTGNFKSRSKVHIASAVRQHLLFWVLEYIQESTTRDLQEAEKQLSTIKELDDSKVVTDGISEFLDLLDMRIGLLKKVTLSLNVGIGNRYSGRKSRICHTEPVTVSFLLDSKNR